MVCKWIDCARVQSRGISPKPNHQFFSFNDFGVCVIVWFYCHHFYFLDVTITQSLQVAHTQLRMSSLAMQFPDFFYPLSLINYFSSLLFILFCVLSEFSFFPLWCFAFAGGSNFIFIIWFSEWRGFGREHHFSHRKWGHHPCRYPILSEWTVERPLASTADPHSTLFVAPTNLLTKQLSSFPSPSALYYECLPPFFMYMCDFLIVFFSCLLCN